MLRLTFMLTLLLAACTPSDRDETGDDDAEEVPIGPGSDSTTLIPPDTPMTRRQPAGAPRSLPDSAPLTTR